jgi:hypothetical protein
MSDLVSPQRAANYSQFPGGIPIQIVLGTGTRVNATAGAASTAAVAVPAGGNILLIRATDSIAIRFGGASVGAAAVDADSILFISGEAPYVLKTGETHFRVIRVGSSDVAVQLESVATL